jgi:hypothetical protein
MAPPFDPLTSLPPVPPPRLPDPDPLPKLPGTPGIWALGKLSASWVGVIEVMNDEGRVFRSKVSADEESTFGSSPEAEDWRGEIVLASVDFGAEVTPAPGGRVVERGIVETWPSAKGAKVGESDGVEVAFGGGAEFADANVSEETARGEFMVASFVANVC